MQGASYVLFAVLLLYSTTVLVLRFATGRWQIIKQPLTWFYASWLIGLAMLAIPFFDYYESFGLESSTYILAVLGSFSLGVVCAAFGNRVVAPTEVNNIAQQRLESDIGHFSGLTKALLLAGIVGSVLLIANAVLSGGLSLSDRLDIENAAAIRNSFMEASGSKIGPLYGPANFASSIGGLGVALAMFFLGARLTERKGWLYWGTVIFLMVNLAGAMVAFGSRMFAVFSLLIAILGFLEGRWAIGENVVFRKINFRQLLLYFFVGLIALSSVLFSATYFLEKRVGKQSASLLLFRTHRANFTKSAYELTRNDVSLQYLLFSASYVSTPIATLVFYLDLPQSRAPGPFYGEYNFPPVARWLRRVTFSNDPTSWESARYEIFKPLSDINFGSNVWSTLIRDLIADFGRLGALIFVFFLGLFAQRLFSMQTNSPNAVRAALLVFLNLILLFSGFISLLFMPQIHWALYGAVFLAFYRKFRAIKKTTVKIPDDCKCHLS